MYDVMSLLESMWHCSKAIRFEKSDLVPKIHTRRVTFVFLERCESKKGIQENVELTDRHGLVVWVSQGNRYCTGYPKTGRFSLP